MGEEPARVPQNPGRANRPPIPTPEDVGFRRLEGADFIKGNLTAGDTNLGRIAGMSIDNTVERRGRFESLLGNVARVANDPEKSRAAITQLAQLSQRAIEGRLGQPEEYDQDIAASLDFTRSVIANFHDRGLLSSVLRRGQTDSIQESIGRVRGRLAIDDADRGHPDINSAVAASFDLAQELYAQEHGGRGYQTGEQRKMIEEAKLRAPQIKVSG